MAQQYCMRCGMLMEEDWKVCPSCGQAVSAPPPPPMSYPSQQPYFPPQTGYPAYPPQQPVVYVMPKPPRPGRGLGIASMVLGIIGVLYLPSMILAFMLVLEEMTYHFGDGEALAMLFPLAFIATFSLLATVFGVVSRKKGYRHGISTSGLTMGLIGLLSYTLMAVLTVVFSV